MNALTSAMFHCAQINQKPSDTDTVPKTKPLSQVCRDLITSLFLLVLIQSRRTSNKHSHASSQVSPAASSGLKENSAADNTDKTKTAKIPEINTQTAE